MSPASASSASRRRVGEVLSAAIAFAGFAWVVYLCSTTFESVDDLFPDSPYRLALSAAFLSVTLFLPSLVFRTLVGEGLSSTSRVLALYFSGQLLKYLPGRIWGIVYQVSATSGSVGGARIVRANLELMLLATLVNVTAAVPILGAVHDWPAYLVWPCTVAGAFLLIVAFGASRRIDRLVFGLLPDAVACLLVRFHGTSRGPRVFASLVTLQVTTLCSYVVAWNFLLDAYPGRFDAEAPELALLYLLASIVGMLSFVTPAGLGVRETAFVGLGVGIAELETLAFLAVLARVWHFATEVALSFLCTVVAGLAHRFLFRCAGGVDRTGPATAQGDSVPIRASPTQPRG